MPTDQVTPDQGREERVANLRTSLDDMIRIVEAMRMSTGLGKNQTARLERAKAALKAAQEPTNG
jgi:hypothetical protein